MITNAQGLPPHCFEIMLDFPVYTNPVWRLLVYICTLLLLDWIHVESFCMSLGGDAW